MTTRMMPAAPGELVSCVEYLYDIGELDVLTLLHFIEKPHRYPKLLAIWDEEREREAERNYDEREYRKGVL